MRHLVSRSLLLAAIALIVSAHPVLFAQPIDSLRPVMIYDSSRAATSIYFSIGVAPVSGENIEAFLSENGYAGSSFPSDMLGGNTIPGIGGQVYHGRWMFMSDFAMLFPRVGMASGADVSHSFWQIQGSGGYLGFRSESLSLTPFLGLGVRTSTLTIDENRGSTFGSILDSGGRAYSFSAMSTHVELGAISDYAFVIDEEESHVTSLLVGLKVGYRIGLEQEEWRIGGRRSIDDGPNVNPNGLQLSLILGTRHQPRVYDARIVAERAPTSNVEHSVVEP